MSRVSPGTLKSLFAFLAAFLIASSARSQTGDAPYFGIIVRNKVLEERFSRQRSEEEPVSTSVMNTNVTGMQSTVTETRLRLIPDPNLIRFELLSSGDVTSQTTGVNRQAVVESTGHHHFDIIKPMSFDGNIFLTVPCHGTIQASQTPNRVVSAAGAAMPLLSRLGDRVAWNEVMRRQPQINRAVAEDVSRDVLPKVDNLIDSDFGRLGKRWKAIQRQTTSVFGDTQVRWFARTTDITTSLWAGSGSRASGSMGRTTKLQDATSQMADDEELVVFLSDHALASLIRQYVPTGLKFTDTQLQKLNDRMNNDEEPDLSLATLMKLANDVRSAEPDPATLFTIEFASVTPLEIRFVEGDVRIISTFQIHPTVGDSSGWITTSFNLRGKGLPEDRWTVSVRSVEVNESSNSPSDLASSSPKEPAGSLVIPQDNSSEDQLPQDSDSGTAVTRVEKAETGTMWLTIVRNAAKSLAEKLPPVTLPLEFDGAGAIPGLPRLRLSRIESTGGMLRVSLRIADRLPVASSRN